ncbi:MAG: cytochrome c peroxidase [Pseudomonadota bacterium]
MKRLAFVFGLLAGTCLADEVPRAVSDADYAPIDLSLVRLGQLLFYDSVLSGNREVACATCHHPRFATSDGLSLGLGDGGVGLGPERRVDPENLPEQRIPRNSPALFNLGAKEFTVLFHDGRIEVDMSRPSGIRTPLGSEMEAGFASLLSAQTMFPVLSPDEMAGHYQENEIAKAVRQGRITGPGGAWDLIATRVTEIPAYSDGFAEAVPEIGAGRPIRFTDISDAVAAFMAHEWRSDDSPFDAHLRGTAPLSGQAAEGFDLFYGRAGCSGCHAGPFQTDHAFHATGQPQLGPGKAARFERHQRDVGRMRVTGREQDAFAFRTPSLRNVTRTGPWGHAGAFTDLAAFLRYHTAPATVAYAPAAVLPALPGAADDWATWQAAAERDAILAAVDVPPVRLTGSEIDALLAFLESLSDPIALSGRLGVPGSVPSGLPVPR